MSRPICFHCGRQLMYVKGKPVYSLYTDPIGAEHKLHKACFKNEGYDGKSEPSHPTPTSGHSDHDR